MDFSAEMGASLCFRQPEDAGVGRQGRTRTYGVSSVADLQSAALAT